MWSWLLSHLAATSGVVLMVLAIAKILSERRTPQSIAAWLLVIVLLPWVGVPLFLAFGGRKMRELADSKRNVELRRFASRTVADSPVEQTLQALGLPPATEGNQVTFEFDGVGAYEALISMLDSARETIEFATFILATDDVGQSVVQKLTEKVRAGCRVRLLLDGLGSRKANRRFLDDFIRVGGQVAWFMPAMHRPFRGRTNLRNHRKIVVVDGRSAWAGGRNTADEYFGPHPAVGRWDDLTVVIEGPAVGGFLDIFESDWAFATKSAAATKSTSPAAPIGVDVVQVVPSGPDVPHDALLGGLLTATFQAKKAIRIVTPYLVPPDAVTQALCLAAWRGVDVQVLMPAVSNHRLADLARGPHLAELHEAGARILLLPRMIHAKGAIFDADLAFVGSANLDERSLLLNFEVMAALYGGSQLRSLTEWFDSLAAECGAWRPTEGRVRRMAEGLAELTAPLL